MAQIPGYNCALSVLGWPEQTPRDEKIITLGPRCAREIQSCAKMSDFHSIFRDWISPIPSKGVRLWLYWCHSSPDPLPSAIQSPDVARNRISKKLGELQLGIRPVRDFNKDIQPGKINFNSTPANKILVGPGLIKPREHSHYCEIIWSRLGH